MRSQISIGLCSTQPGLRQDLLVLELVAATSLPAWSKIMNRVLVVPWSTAPTKSAMGALLLRCQDRRSGVVLVLGQPPGDLVLVGEVPPDEQVVEPAPIRPPMIGPTIGTQK